MKKILIPFFCIAVLAASSVSGQVVIWNQAPEVDTDTLVGLIDQDFSDSPSSSTFMVADVTLNSSSGFGYTVTSITTYFTNQRGTWATGVTDAQLTYFADDGQLDTEVAPTQMVSVDVTAMTIGGDSFVEVTASGLDICLDDGDYWFGLTPIASFGGLGQEFHLGTSAGTVGEVAWARNPGETFFAGWQTVQDGFGSGAPAGWDMSLQISGIEKTGIPEPASASLVLLGFTSIVFRRRR